MFDGDPRTAFLERFQGHPQDEFAPYFTVDPFVLDLSFDVPINRIRFYPRLGLSGDQHLVDALRQPAHPRAAFGDDSFSENALEGFVIRTGSDAVVETAPCEGVLGHRGKDLLWEDLIDGGLDLLSAVTEGLDIVVDFSFPTRSVRWLSFAPGPFRYETGVVTFEIAELEIYGEGFVSESMARTKIFDFGSPVTWGRIRWEGDVPPGTRLEVRSRTGKTPNPNRYFSKDLNGALSPVSYEEYEELNTERRPPPQYDRENWTVWSAPYRLSPGTGDSSQPGGERADGATIVSKGLTQYIQLEIRMFSRPDSAPQVDRIGIQLSEDSAAKTVLAEVWPIAVPSHESATFTYVVSPSFGDDNTGFDRLEILTHTHEFARSVPSRSLERRST